MAVGGAIAAVIAALIGAGTAIGTGVAGSRETERARREAREIYEDEERRRRRELREQREISQQKLGLEKEAINLQWAEFAENKRKYREEMNKAMLGAIGNTLNKAAQQNAAFRDKLLSYRRV